MVSNVHEVLEVSPQTKIRKAGFDFTKQKIDASFGRCLPGILFRRTSKSLISVVTLI